MARSLLHGDAWHTTITTTNTAPVRQSSLNFLDIVDELAVVSELAPVDADEEPGAASSDHQLGGCGGAVGAGQPDPTATTLAAAAAGALEASEAQQQQGSCSGLSSNMDFETQHGTAESARQPGGHAGDMTPLSQWSSDTEAFAVRPAPPSVLTHAVASSMPMAAEPIYPVTPVEASVASCMLADSLLPSAMPDDEVASMVFHGVVAGHALHGVGDKVKVEPGQAEALDELLRKGLPDAVESFGAPVLGGFDSRDSVHSAPGLGAYNSFDSLPPAAASCKPEPNGMGRCHSVEVSQMAGPLGILSRSFSSITPGVKRTYSTAGPGTNRPPKEGSLSALLPKDKLQRKRAAARRYYHNQKNKAVDYEVTIARLETENNALSRELMNALKQLEMLKKAKTSPGATAVC